MKSYEDMGDVGHPHLPPLYGIKLLSHYAVEKVIEKLLL